MAAAGAGRRPGMAAGAEGPGGQRHTALSGERSQWKCEIKLPCEASQRSSNRTGIAREEGKKGCVVPRGVFSKGCVL